MQTAIICIYAVTLAFIFIYSLFQLALALNYRRDKMHEPEPIKLDLEKDEIPYVTIQLPIFNEYYVVDRLLDNISRMQYPKDRLEIQVLDDSTDETVEVVRKKVEEIRQQGIDIVHVHRTNRSGFKAGALKEGIEIAKGEFFAIFDADFLPDDDFLINTMAYFKDPKVAVVQTRWGHINKDYSILTKIQAFALDTHFTIEQRGRNSKGYFLNFNGTGGIWRKEAIYDAGNWNADTLTEDLDLSYRAQINGWKVKYLENIISNAELPITMSAIKGQQFRWTKGGAQNLVKISKRVLRSNAPFMTKINGIYHLFNSSLFVVVFLMSILSVPLFYIKNQTHKYDDLFNLSAIFLMSFFILLFYFWLAYDKRSQGRKAFPGFLMRFFVFLSYAMALGFHNTIAVFEGLLGIQSSFLRTPKFNVNSKKDSWQGNKYAKKKISYITIIEGLLSLYFLAALVFAFIWGDFSFAYLHVMLFAGYTAIFILSLRQ
ncbi:MAG: glycosyltransferase family 2 protein [Bacteroidota bacterium]|nr:glycosyltransferase family 2 protein [Bacteroidota bacterium]MDP4205760.1 glycosyltransferase family 2 protein [Bacteroidota bacterium]